MKKVHLEEIPLIPIEKQDNVLETALDVFANGEKAKIFISQRDHLSFNGDDRIVIVWDKPNKEFGESFTTKYFIMDEPGILLWGHEGGKITVEHLDV
jgi:hypothetical protein